MPIGYARGRAHSARNTTKIYYIRIPLLGSCGHQGAWSLIIKIPLVNHPQEVTLEVTLIALFAAMATVGLLMIAVIAAHATLTRED